MMEPEMYDGTVHPEVWLNKIKAYCYKNQINTAEEIVVFCKSMIHPSIKVHGTYLYEIIYCLKEDISFISFKNSIKRRFNASEYNFKCDENGILKALNQFRQHCYEGEITEIEEQKKLFLNIIKNNPIQYNFINNNINKINSINDLLKYFEESMLEERRLVKYGSCVTLKHVASGKYLSSCDIKYETGSKHQVVYAGNMAQTSNALWIISHPIEQKEILNVPLIYGNVFYLRHKESEKRLFPDSYHMTGNHAQVYVHGNKNECALFYCIKTKDNDSSYVNTNDTVYLKSEKEEFILGSHDLIFKLKHESFQEVFGHKESKERIDRIDEWLIEVVE